MEKSADSPKTRLDKKAYRTPKLKTYGNVQQLTQTGMGGAAFDNGQPQPGKTGIGTV